MSKRLKCARYISSLKKSKVNVSAISPHCWTGYTEMRNNKHYFNIAAVILTLEQDVGLVRKNVQVGKPQSSFINVKMDHLL